MVFVYFKHMLISRVHRQLKSVVEQVNNINELQLPIGLLTGEHRDTWATVKYLHLRIYVLLLLLRYPFFLGPQIS